MAAETLAELRAELIEVKAEISKARRSKGYADGNFSLTRQELNNLQADKNELIKKINARERGGIRMRSIRVL